MKTNNFLLSQWSSGIVDLSSLRVAEVVTVSHEDFFKKKKAPRQNIVIMIWNLLAEKQAASILRLRGVWGAWGGYGVAVVNSSAQSLWG